MTVEKRLTTLRFKACADQLKTVRNTVVSAMKGLACAESEIDRMVLAVNEACMNVIQHGYCSDGMDGNVSDEIGLDISVAGEEVIFRITDQAATIDPDKIKSRDLSDIRPGGLGVHFILEIMDKIEFIKPQNGTGNILEMRKRIQ
jgi:sigma-B regulation protein RsbU (phosphoserine phosphatase)